MQRYQENKIEMSFVMHLQVAAMDVPKQRSFQMYILFYCRFSYSFFTIWENMIMTTLIQSIDTLAIG